MSDNANLTDLQNDILKEVANIGSGNAATALAGILGRQVTISTGKLDVAAVKNIDNVLGHKGEPAVAVYSLVSGDVKGGCLIFMNQTNTLLLTDSIMGRSQGETKVLTDEDRSMLKEVGLILSAAYLEALSKLSGLSFLPTVPNLIYKRSEEIAAFITEDLEREGEEPSELLICLQTQFSQNQEKIPGEFLLFLDSRSFNVLLEAIEKFKG